MRRWRVGSISMGLLLIFLGVMLLLSQMIGWDMAMVAMGWLPAVLIVLGIEVLIYLFLSKQEQPIIKYDIFSILLISIIGVLSVGAYVVSSTGIAGAFEQMVEAEEVEGALPVVEHQVDEQVTRIVIDSSEFDVSLEGDNTEQVTILGAFRSNVLKAEDIEGSDVASIQQIGDTLYVRLFQAPRQQGLRYDHSRYSYTVSVPTDIDVEVRSRINDAHISVDELQANWYFEEVEEVMLHHQQQANLTLQANVRDMEYREKTGGDSPYQPVDRTFGEGTYHLHIGQVEQLHIKD
ncbi:hypothetical protein [Aquibacillus sediminis]|uniref:hypothetical protein n=1 Tax=Aquibacillus sediminis TaxID=2574734 RepID=UPI001109071E|nr:hypothetical protein [Aquibacillus sediminis]